MSDTYDALRTAEGRFVPGESGNPAGRPKGSRNKATLVAEALLDEATGPVVAKAIDEALGGDGAMLRTVFQAVWKKDPGRTIELDIPEERYGDPVVFLEATMRAVALGEITPQEAALLARLGSVMVQAQRLKLRIDQWKAKDKERTKSRDVAAEAPEETPRTTPDGSDARVDGREEPGRATAVPPVSRLYSRAHPVEPCIAPVFSREGPSSIPPVDPRGDERRKAA
jgi:hypothetical protein